MEAGRVSHCRAARERAAVLKIWEPHAKAAEGHLTLALGRSSVRHPALRRGRDPAARKKPEMARKRWKIPSALCWRAVLSAGLEARLHVRQGCLTLRRYFTARKYWAAGVRASSRGCGAFGHTVQLCRSALCSNHRPLHVTPTAPFVHPMLTLASLTAGTLKG